MDLFAQYFKFIVISLFLVILSYILWIPAAPNPLSPYSEPKIVSSIQDAWQHESNNIIIASSFSQNSSTISSPSSLFQEVRGNDTVTVLAGPTLIDGTGDPPKQNAVIIIRGKDRKSVV